MATVKTTFTLDQESVIRLEDAAARLALPKSEVVRRAIGDFHHRIGLLSEREKAAMLRVLDDVASRPSERPARAVDRELAALRESRRSGGRRSGGPRRS
ncbi:MAG: hypothetical protein ACRD44_02205 [Bryobacteraceae bacterium]